jgi:hypothetical protein
MPPAAVAVIRVYIDNETVPSIVFQPAKIAGVGIGDVGVVATPTGLAPLPPWSNSWFGQSGRNASVVPPPHWTPHTAGQERTHASVMRAHFAVLLIFPF